MYSLALLLQVKHPRNALSGVFFYVNRRQCDISANNTNVEKYPIMGGFNTAIPVNLKSLFQGIGRQNA